MRYSDDTSPEKLEEIIKNYYAALNAANDAADQVAHFVNNKGKMSDKLFNDMMTMHDQMDSIVTRIKNKEYLEDGRGISESSPIDSLDETSVLWLKKWAGTITEEEQKP